MKEDLDPILSSAGALLHPPYADLLRDPVALPRTFGSSPAQLSDSRLEVSGPGRRPTRPLGLSRRALVKALAHMESHLTDESSLDELASAAGVSRSHFCRMFRVSTGYSPMNYWVRMKVKHAKTLLLRGDQRAIDIALSLGFFDQSHFSRTFRRITGLSPGEYLRSHDLADLTVSTRICEDMLREVNGFYRTSRT